VTDQTETARELLWRHQLPEDIIDGALCLHAQELADKIRSTDLPDWFGSLDSFENGVGWAGDLIDPTVSDGLAGTANAEQYRAVPSAVPAPAADRAGLREQIAEALVAWTYRGKNPEHGGILETVRANAYSRADAVLAVLFGPIPAGTDAATWTAIRAIQLMNEAGPQRDVELPAIDQTTVPTAEEIARRYRYLAAIRQWWDADDGGAEEIAAAVMDVASGESAALRIEVARLNRRIHELEQQPAAAPAADRGAVYRDLADQQTQLAVADDLQRDRDMATARRRLVAELRRMADETPQPDAAVESPACKFAEGCHRVVPCVPGCGVAVDGEEGPAATIRRAAAFVREGSSATPPGVGEALAALLEESARRCAAAVKAAVHVWGDAQSPESRRFLETGGGSETHALTLARALLAGVTR
jgi:hypothetical protein